MPHEDSHDKGFSQRELQMAARAMIEMCGDDAPNKAIGRAGEYPQDGKSEGRQFWVRLAEVIQETLDRPSGDEPNQT